MVMRTELWGQLTVEDLFAATEAVKPLFSAGDVVYVRQLDTVRRAKIGQRSWLCNFNDRPACFGYNVDFDDGSHNCMWDYQIGDILFSSEREARRVADKLHFDKLHPEGMAFTELRGFEYSRDCDGYRLTATIGKIGATELYEKEFLCYHFIRKYPTADKRDKKYNDFLKSMEAECRRNDGVEAAPALETLYMVTPGLYASIGYAQHNGVRGRKSE